jgi:hypothetical protein
MSATHEGAGIGEPTYRAPYLPIPIAAQAWYRACNTFHVRGWQLHIPVQRRFEIQGARDYSIVVRARYHLEDLGRRCRRNFRMNSSWA